MCLTVFLFLGGSSGPQTLDSRALGATYWVCQTNAVDGGAASTQAQAARNWLNKLGGEYVQSGPCGVLGTPRYSFCPISDRSGADAGFMEVPLICARSHSRSPDGITCPGPRSGQ